MRLIQSYDIDSCASVPSTAGIAGVIKKMDEAAFTGPLVASAPASKRP